MAKKQNIEKRNPADGIQRRYEVASRTRYLGYETADDDLNPEYLYGSVLAEGPVAAVDKVERRARVRDLPLGPAFADFRSWEKSERKSGEGYTTYALKKKLTLEGFHIRRGKSGKVFGPDELLYLSLFAPPVKGYLLKPFVDALIALAKADLLDLGPAKERRGRAYKLLRTVFDLNAVEMRIDLPFPESRKVDALLVEYRDREGRFRVSSWEKRYKNGYLLKPYRRPFGRTHYLRVEMVFYFRPDDPFELPYGMEAALRTLWPRYVENVEYLRVKGRKPELAGVLKALWRWKSLGKRIRELELRETEVAAVMKANLVAPRRNRVF
jgi:hypothetical protein